MVAESWVGDIKEVAKTVPLTLILDARLNSVPFTLIAVSADFTDVTDGETEEAAGTAYTRLAVAEADLVESAWLVAVIVTEPDGIGSGAV
jgi:hypothetical protein